MSFQIAVDTGGTFTDVVVSDSDGETWISKSLTDAARASTGIVDAVEDIARQSGTSVERLFAEADLLLYGTTRSTNAVVEGKSDTTALLCTRGFRDTLYLREGGKLEPFNYHMAYPKPYVPRRLTYEIDERVNAEGHIIRPLDLDSVETAVRAALEAGATTFAVSLLWSMLHPEHEIAVREVIKRIAPETPCTLSHELNPIVREYRRTSSTAIDASLKPLMQRYLRDLEQDLEQAGFRGSLLLATSFGGAWEIADVIDKPIYSIGSGPAMAPRAALSVVEEELENLFSGRDTIVCDVGGTTFDVSLVSDGTIHRTSEAWLGEQFLGHMLGISCVDVRSIGAGGGSIAWVDEGGLLRLGPHSAGADPGPVCYGRGGTRPTVTDAAAVLGYLDPASFLGGRMTLHVDAAREAITTHIADPLGLDTDEAASGTLRLAAEAMVSAIRDVTISQGVDPRTSIIVSGGGAGGLNIANIARELECDEVLVPGFAGVMSAWGGHRSDIITEIRRTFITDTGLIDEAAVNEFLTGLDRELDEKVGALEVEATSVHKEFFAEARYPNQLWELPVPLSGPRLSAEEDLEGLIERFHELHERHYSVREEGADLEILTWIARMTVSYDTEQNSQIISRTDNPEGEGDGDTVAHFAEAGRVPARRAEGCRLPAGTVLPGPCFIDEPTTTIVVPPDWSVEVLTNGHYLLTRNVDDALATEKNRG